MPQLAQEALRKLGAPAELGRAQQAYAQGRSTQIPAHTTFNTGQRRISRKITVGISTVRYENDYNDWIASAIVEGLTSLVAYHQVVLTVAPCP